MLKRRLQDDTRQREGAEKEMRHILTQLTDIIQKQEVNDATDNGEEIRIEQAPAEMRGSTGGVSAREDTG